MNVGKSYMRTVCGLSNEYKSNLPSNKHYLSRNENKTWKKIQACIAFELMTSKPVQCSTNWANKPINWELIIIMLVCDKPEKWWINENQICELWTVIFSVKNTLLKHAVLIVKIRPHCCLSSIHYWEDCFMHSVRFDCKSIVIFLFRSIGTHIIHQKTCQSLTDSFELHINYI